MRGRGRPIPRLVPVALAAIVAVAAAPGAGATTGHTPNARPRPQAPLRVVTSTAQGQAGTPIALRTRGGSGNGRVRFAATGAGCRVTGRVLSADRPTTCRVVATKAASGRYGARRSTPVRIRFAGAPQAPLLITSASTTGTVGVPIVLSATGGSGTGATAFSVTGATCSVDGSLLSATSPTACTVIASRAASGSYRAAVSPPVTFTFAASPAPPPPPGGGSTGTDPGGGGGGGGGGGTAVPQATLVISNTTTSGYADTPIALTTSGGSGTGAVTFATTGSGCSIEGTAVRATSATTCSVTATKAASPGYLPATSAPVDFVFASAGVAVSVDLFGIHVDPALDGRTTLDPSVVRLWDLQVAWADVNPTAGTFVWTDLDRRVAEVEALGAKPLLVLGITPSWAASGTDAAAGYGPGSASPPTDPADYGAYVSAVATRYAGRIAAYEAWNEANISTYWTGTAAQMADLTQRARDAVHAADPAARVLSASVTLRLANAFGGFNRSYYAALKDRGWPVDGLTFHSYPSGTGTPVDRYALVTQWKSMIADVAGTPFEDLGRIALDTEVNYGLAGPGAIPGTHYDDTTGAAFLARTYVDSVRLGIATTVWYIWMGAYYDVIGVQLNSSTLAANAAYSVMKAWLDGSTYRGCTTSGPLTECHFAKAGSPFTLAFADAAGTPYGGGSGTATFIDGTTAPGVAVTTLGIAPVRFT